MGGKKRDAKNEIYAQVDEEFISKFSNNHASFMKTFYYKSYVRFCNARQRKPLKEAEFFTNMRRRRIQLFQLCCPYCGTVMLAIHDKKRQGKAGYNYCVNCGKGSAVENILNQVYRFIRISNVNRIGLEALKKKYPNEHEWVIGYDCYQMELIELASIIEVIFRDFFEALIYISNLGVKNEYIERVIDKHTGNDFMNIDKANDNYKKAFGINIKKALNKEVWDDLIDIVNLRNMMVHNNGMVDSHFKTTTTYPRVKDKLNGNLYMLKDEELQKYLISVISAATDISNIYLNRYYMYRNSVIASYYFNNGFPTFNKGSEEPANTNS